MSEQLGCKTGEVIMTDFNKQIELAALFVEAAGMEAENEWRKVDGDYPAFLKNDFGIIVSRMRALKDDSQDGEEKENKWEHTCSNGNKVRPYPAVLCSMCKASEKPQEEPTYCGLTAKQWERVRDEMFLVQVSDDGVGWSKYAPTFLVDIDLKSPEQKFEIGTKDYKDFFNHCRPYRSVGVRQPHFGGEYPGNPKDWILVKNRNESTYWMSVQWAVNWTNWPDITEYIVLKEAKP